MWNYFDVYFTCLLLAQCISHDDFGIVLVCADLVTSLATVGRSPTAIDADPFWVGNSIGSVAAEEVGLETPKIILNPSLDSCLQASLQDLVVARDSY